MDKFKLIKATEARKNAKDLNAEIHQKQLQDCDQAIRQAMSAGKFECTIQICVNETVETEIKSKGYVVTKGDDQRDGAYTKINWNTNESNPNP